MSMFEATDFSHSISVRVDDMEDVLVIPLELPMNEADFKDDPDYVDFVTPTYDFYEDDEVSASKMPDIDYVKSQNDIDTYHRYVTAQVRVPIGDEIRTGKVVQRKCELYGTVRE
jgi:hypothetical protein